MDGEARPRASGRVQGQRSNSEGRRLPVDTLQKLYVQYWRITVIALERTGDGDGVVGELVRILEVRYM